MADPETIRGTFGTNQFESGIKKLDVRDFIFQLQPEEAPFTTLLQRIRKEPTVDVEFSWFEDDLLGKYTAINNATGYNTSATTLKVDRADIFIVNDIVKNTRTGEVMLITAIDTTNNTITVTRAWGVTAAAAINDDDPIFRLGNAQAEGWSAPGSVITKKVKKSNYIQIFSKTVEFTTTAAAIATYGGKRRDYERKKKGVELKRDLESQFLFGEPKLDTSGPQPRYQTGGLLYFLQQGNAPALNANGKKLTKSAFDLFMRELFTYGSSEKILIASPMIIGQINEWAEGSIVSDPKEYSKWGFKFQTYYNTYGTINMAPSRQFIGPYAGYGIVIDPKEIVYRYLEGNDFTLALDIQPKDTHVLRDEYHGQVGLEVHHAVQHGYIYNVTDTPAT